jgi:hypothetical protein
MLLMFGVSIFHFIDKSLGKYYELYYSSRNDGSVIAVNYANAMGLTRDTVMTAAVHTE